MDKLVGTVTKCNNTYHRTIKMKPVDVLPSMFIDFNKWNNKECPKFKFGDKVRISKYNNIFVPYWSKEVFMIIKLKNTILWIYAFRDLNGKEIFKNFTKKTKRD